MSARNPDQALLQAARTGDIGAIRAALAMGAAVDGPPGADATPLMIAAEKGHALAAAYLLDAGANLEAAKKGVAALHKAAGKGQLEVVRLLVERGANVNARAKDGFTPLLEAARSRHPDAPAIFFALLEAGAAANDLPRRESPFLLAACESKQPEIVKWALGRLPPEAATKSSRVAAMAFRELLGSSKGSSARALEIAEALIRAGFPINSEEGARALADAARSDKFAPIVELLLKSGADPNGQAHNPLEAAAANLAADNVRILLKAGAIHCYWSGSTPLVRAFDNTGPPERVRKVVAAFLEVGTNLFGEESWERARAWAKRAASPEADSVLRLMEDAARDLA